eukprot:36266-Pyramimonas_sp.AAC.1
MAVSMSSHLIWSCVSSSKASSLSASDFWYVGMSSGGHVQRAARRFARCPRSCGVPPGWVLRRRCCSCFVV